MSDCYVEYYHHDRRYDYVVLDDVHKHFAVGDTLVEVYSDCSDIDYAHRYTLHDRLYTARVTKVTKCFVSFTYESEERRNKFHTFPGGTQHERRRIRRYAGSDDLFTSDVRFVKRAATRFNVEDGLKWGSYLTKVYLSSLNLDTK